MSEALKNHLRIACFVLVWGFISSCVSVPKYIDIQLPAYASNLFIECSSINGALIFKYNRDGNTEEAIDFEWAAKSSGDWGLASYSPFGQTLFYLNFLKEKQIFETSAQNSPWLNAVSIGSDGFLRYKNQLLGVRPDEFPCFWQGRLPRVWLRQVIAMNQSSDGIQLQIRDQERNILVQIARHGSGLLWNWKAMVDWESFWGLRHYAMQLQSRRDHTVQLNSDNFRDIECQWTPKDEGN